jgi:type IV secretory pathway VirB9-like protein
MNKRRIFIHQQIGQPTALCDFCEVKMKICRNFILLLFSAVALGQTQAQPGVLPEARVSSLTIGADPVTVIHVRPGYVTSVRLPEEVSSVVIGDPKSFDAEHSEAEPRLVFLRPLMTKPSETNLLITTKTGHEVPLHIISDGKASGGQVDFLVDYQRPHSFLIPESLARFSVAENKDIALENQSPPRQPNVTDSAMTSPAQSAGPTPNWKGKELQIAVTGVRTNGHKMTVDFSVLNNSSQSVEVLPPQIQLSGLSTKGHNKKTKAEQLPIEEYRLTSRKLEPGKAAAGSVVFNRPSFKESTEQLLLQMARADEIDRPVLAPITFTAQTERRGL